MNQEFCTLCVCSWRSQPRDLPNEMPVCSWGAVRQALLIRYFLSCQFASFLSLKRKRFSLLIEVPFINVVQKKHCNFPTQCRAQITVQFTVSDGVRKVEDSELWFEWVKLQSFYNKVSWDSFNKRNFHPSACRLSQVRLNMLTASIASVLI